MKGIPVKMMAVRLGPKCTIWGKTRETLRDVSHPRAAQNARNLTGGGGGSTTPTTLAGRAVQPPPIRPSRPALSNPALSLQPVTLVEKGR